MPKSTAANWQFWTLTCPLFEFKKAYLKLLSDFPFLIFWMSDSTKTSLKRSKHHAWKHVHIHKVEIKAFPWLANITSSILATTNGKSCTWSHKKTKPFFAVGMSTHSSSFKRHLEKICWMWLYSLSLWFLFDVCILILSSDPVRHLDQFLPSWGPHDPAPDSQPLPAHTMTVNDKKNTRKSVWGRDDFDAAQLLAEFFFPKTQRKAQHALSSLMFILLTSFFTASWDLLLSVCCGPSTSSSFIFRGASLAKWLNKWLTSRPLHVNSCWKKWGTVSDALRFCNRLLDHFGKSSSVEIQW